MANTHQFDDIRPYTDSEVPAAIARVLSDERFDTFMRNMFPKANIGFVRQELQRVSTVHELQHRLMRNAMAHIIRSTTTAFAHTGIEQLQLNTPYLYVSNHRDIMLDASLLCYCLVAHSNIDTPEITFGSNLMQTQLIVDLGKINKMFRFMRSNGSPRELVSMSQQNSAYIRHAITEKRESVWIAQRNGRTKDGNDRTDVGVLKMFAMSAPNNLTFSENLGQLNIVPLCISYEYEPCDAMKTNELYISRSKRYEKQPGEDIRSVVHGVVQPKGHVHLAVCPTITPADIAQCAEQPSNARYKALASIIDQRIHAAYRLWPTNYIAHDLLHGANTHQQHYTAQQREQFAAYMSHSLSPLNGNANELREIFLSIYANPVDNVLNATNKH
ncbi:MAG: 1-acyl-sn-glycerol-3-phosphate acyltransferase [Bacteroidales bacterium]|nr:1-acyl-sn-glycerol-3-phosphate acyltransferase [Bacteroidales bacterium]